jgi:hypothetical protein
MIKIKSCKSLEIIKSCKSLDFKALVLQYNANKINLDGSEKKLLNEKKTEAFPRLLMSTSETKNKFWHSFLQNKKNKSFPFVLNKQ